MTEQVPTKTKMKVIDSRMCPPFKAKGSISQKALHEGRMYSEMYFGNKDLPDYLRDSPILQGDNIIEAAQGIMDNPADNLVRLMDDSGLSRGLICGFDTRSAGGRYLPNDEVARIKRKYPDRFIALAGVDPRNGTEAVREFERAITELGLEGLRIAPFELDMFPNDRRLYPLYEKCVEHDVVFESHCSVNFTQTKRMDLAHPRHLDDVACDFPELKIIADHGGWPWIDEVVAQAWRHYNFYICISAIRPCYLAAPHSGWEMLLHYGNSVIQDKILWASTWPFLPIKRGIEETMQLPLKEKVREKWFYKNAARLFKIED
jgi:predicted TIM-barrel fold metal-dependent hydrolase